MKPEAPATITFRQLTAADKAQYRRVRLNCLQQFPDNFGSLHSEEANQAELKFEQYLATNAANTFMLGGFDDETLIAICGFVQEERIKTRHRGEIVQMFVDAHYAGRHIGEQLLRQTIAQAFENPDIQQIVLSVVAGNERAITTYKNVGFVEYGFLEGYFRLDGKSWNQHFMVLERTGI